MKKLIVIVTTARILSALPALASWSDDPLVNTPISTESGSQRAPVIASDGAGGAIIAWHDSRSGLGDDIFAQRVDRFGTVQWTGNGIAISDTTDSQFNPVVVSDGASGAIIAWVDERSGTGSDIYAQRVSAAGMLQWAQDGVPVSAASSSQFSPRITSDGAGGAVIAWVDDRSGVDDIFAQRVAADGAMLWDPDGIPICEADRFQTAPAIIEDGAGGAIITWHDFRNSAHNDIFAQRVSSGGAVMWTADGIGICTFGGNQEFPVLAPDGMGGAIIAWEDYRNGPLDVFAQRVEGSAGSPQWDPSGVSISLASGDQLYISIVSDASQGAIMAWQDHRSGSIPDIFAQRIGSGGAVQWVANGVPVCVFSGHQRVPVCVRDGAGGAIITWQDSRSGSSYDIFAQRIEPVQGARQWTPANGVAISTAAGNQFIPVLVSDSGGAIIAWEDFRSGIHWDIFAQQVDASGKLGNPITAVNGPSVEPPSLVLHPGRPNPFAHETTIAYELAAEARVRIRILDVTGREVELLTDGLQPAGPKSIRFDAGRLPAGLYLCELNAGGRLQSMKLAIRR